jgi:hypothetical protein
VYVIKCDLKKIGGGLIMRQIAVVLAIAIIAFYAVPVFADVGTPASTIKGPKVGESTVFQKISDSITKTSAKPKDKSVAKEPASSEARPSGGKSTIFQGISDNISQWSLKSKGKPMVKEPAEVVKPERKPKREFNLHEDSLFQAAGDEFSALKAPPILDIKCLKKCAKKPAAEGAIAEEKSGAVCKGSIFQKMSDCITKKCAKAK